MRWCVGMLLAGAALAGAAVAAAPAAAPGPLAPGLGEVRPVRPVKLTLLADDESIYGAPTPVTEAEGVNAGGVNIDMKVTYLDDYLYRGLSRSKLGFQERGAHLQFDGSLSFDLGKLPHPFVGAFVNVFDSDPVSRFQEIRPVVGAVWRVRPLIVSAGHTGYIFPNRDVLDTAEVWGQVTLDDSALLRTRKPLLSPYVLGAYDYDLYNGWYLEAGVRHDLVIEGTNIALTFTAAVGYVLGVEQFAVRPGRDSGFQHYQLGLIGRYSLNTLLNIPRRYGEWSLVGYLYYTDGLVNFLRADTQLWGGGGLQFRY